MPTMNDVARKAGVSRGTVSNVINGAKVKPESKRRVEEAIRELGYVPDAYARGFKQHKTSTIVLIIPTVWNPFFSKLTACIEKELRRHGYRLLLCQSNSDEKEEIEYVEAAKQHKADGILSITFSNIWPALEKSGIPLVTIDRYFSSDIPYISTDNYLGGKMAVWKFRELGCRNLLFVGREPQGNLISKMRMEGFTNECQELSIPCSVISSDCSSQEFPAYVEERIRRAYENGIPYDGIFVSVDRYADFVMDALASSKTAPRVPEDVQIIGFDGVGTHQNDAIRISSIAQPVEELARESVDMLIAQIEKKPFVRSMVLRPSFVQGKTTKPQN